MDGRVRCAQLMKWFVCVFYKAPVNFVSFFVLALLHTFVLLIIRRMQIMVHFLLKNYFYFEIEILEMIISYFGKV